MDKQTMVQLECPHYRGEGYFLKLGSDCELMVCEHCMMNLASEVMSNLALQVFARNIAEDDKEL